MQQGSSWKKSLFLMLSFLCSLTLVAQLSAANDDDRRGKVSETFDSGGYTYVKVSGNNKETWVAVPQMPVAVGDEIVYEEGTEMGAFSSPTLKRSFDNIIFTSGLTVNRSAKKLASEEEKQKAVQVEKATGADAYRISELYSKKAGLDKKQVRVRGKVVKVSKKVFGHNWLHLLDGSGQVGKGDHKLVVTTAPNAVEAAVGDVVTVSGTVDLNKDFGAGFGYEVMLEEVTVEK